MAVRIVIATKKPASPAARIGLALMVLLAGLALLLAGALLLSLLGVAAALSVGMLAGIFLFTLAGTVALLCRRALMQLLSKFHASGKRRQPVAQLQPRETPAQLPASVTARHRQENLNQIGPEGKPETQ